ncbi:MAG: protein-disulfide reductase DsbD family protein [Xanthobacteraceae bacterium]
MIAPALRHHVTPVFVAVVTAVTMLGPALAAATSSDWVGDFRSAFRLVSGASKDGMLRAGVEVRLAPGWKTYWRYAGDSGIPPRFDFTRSQNLKSVEVGWPAPHAWHDDAGTAIGYKHAVIFPLRITAQDEGRPVQLVLAFDYAICERICVPVSGEAQLQIPPSVSVSDAALAAAEARVPTKSVIGADAPLSIRAVTQERGGPQPRIVVDVAAPPGEKIELFAEGPAADWALPVPEPAGQGPGGTQRFTFALDGAPPGVDPKGATLRLTAVAGDRAIEVPFHLDEPAKPALR